MDTSMRPAVCLFATALLCVLGLVLCRECQPTECGCENKTNGETVNFTAARLNHDFIVNDTKSDVIYVLGLCGATRCNNSKTAVCAVNNTDNTITSYGSLASVRYTIPNSPESVNVSVDIVFEDTSRTTHVGLVCSYSAADGTNVSLVSANTTTLVFSIHTNLSCLTFASTTSTPVISSTSTAVISSTSQPVTSTPVTTAQPETTLPSSVLVTPSFNTTTPTPTPSIPTPTPSNTTPMPSNASVPAPMPSNTSVPQPVTNTTLSPLPSNTTAPPPLPSNSPVPPSHTPTPSQHCLVQECASDCSEKLAIAVGVSIPGTAILTVLIMILTCFFCQKAKSKRSYSRLAPTVNFDEEDRD